MSNLEWKNGHVEIDPPKRTKKITGTRFAAVLGYNEYKTPFEVWCEVTRTYEKPFEDTQYTIAGKTIEPKQAMFAKLINGFPGFKKPEDVFGKDYFKTTRGDFFPEREVFGGMWDYLSVNKDDTGTVLEMKTAQAKKAFEWAEDIPENYALQAALYAYLLGFDDVCMVCSFLNAEDGDYEHPEEFIPTNSNTITVPFKVSERYPTFEEDYVRPALDFWRRYVLTGISPDYDEKKDADILKELRKKVVDTEATETADLIAEAEELQAKLDANKAAMKPFEDRLSAIKDAFKKDSVEQMDDGTDKVILEGSRYSFTTSKTVTMKVDTAALKKDGLYDKYAKPTVTYKITAALRK